jgi:hypothetical protein
MSSRAEYDRRRGIEAQERAEHATKLETAVAFRDVAAGWFTLAETASWLDGEMKLSTGHKKNQGGLGL